jgi:HK97 gp10 family phage protein
MAKTTSYKVEGLKELQKQLKKFDEDVIKTAARLSAKKAMEPVRDRARAGVSEDDGTLKASIKLSSGTSSGKSSTKIAWAYVGAGGKGKKDAEGTPAGAYVLPVHYGTQHMEANPFLEKAFVPHVPSILSDYKSELTTQTEKGLAKMDKRKGKSK